MVRRLVQQQNIRLLQQKLGERDAHLPAARELFRAPRPVLFAESQAIQYRPNLRLDRVAVARAELAVEPVEAIGDTAVFFARRDRDRPCDASEFPVLLRSRADSRKQPCIPRRRVRPESVSPS